MISQRLLFPTFLFALKYSVEDTYYEICHVTFAWFLSHSAGIKRIERLFFTKSGKHNLLRSLFFPKVENHTLCIRVFTPKVEKHIDMEKYTLYI